MSFDTKARVIISIIVTIIYVILLGLSHMPFLCISAYTIFILGIWLLRGKRN